jgi:hypothetical protein
MDLSATGHGRSQASDFKVELPVEIIGGGRTIHGRRIE